MRTQQSVLITGATSGIGLELARKLVKTGRKVYGTGLHEKTIAQARAEIDSENFEIFKCDIKDKSDIQKLFVNIAALDILINNAGIITRKSLEETTPEKITEVIQTDLLGQIMTTKYALPLLKSSTNAQVINISSTSGQVGKANHTVYAAAKFGLRGFSEALSDELKPYGIRVCCISPGGVKTQLYENAHDDADTTQYMDSKDVAQTIVGVIDSPRSMNITQMVINRGIFT